jgi:hypothetical protein
MEAIHPMSHFVKAGALQRPRQGWRRLSRRLLRGFSPPVMRCREAINRSTSMKAWGVMCFSHLLAPVLKPSLSRLYCDGPVGPHGVLVPSRSSHQQVASIFDRISSAQAETSPSKVAAPGPLRLKR